MVERQPTPRGDLEQVKWHFKMKIPFLVEMHGDFEMKTNDEGAPKNPYSLQGKQQQAVGKSTTWRRRHDRGGS